MHTKRWMSIQLISIKLFPDQSTAYKQVYLSIIYYYNMCTVYKHNIRFVVAAALDEH